MRHEVTVRGEQLAIENKHSNNTRHILLLHIAPATWLRCRTVDSDYGATTLRHRLRCYGVALVSQSIPDLFMHARCKLFR